MIVRGWNNGSRSTMDAGYGLKVKLADRDKFFNKDWKSVQPIFEGSENPVEVNITPSFWRGCCELRSKEIGCWFHRLGCAKWPKYKTPKFSMEPNGPKSFLVHPL